MKNLVHHYASCTSTHDIAHELLNKNAPHGTCVTADRQTCGKGRNGRKWVTTPFSIALSMIIETNVRLSQAAQINFLTTKIICETLLESGYETTIKWPNDVLLKNSNHIPHLPQYLKVCGILIDTKINDQIITNAILSMGINIKRPKLPIKDLPLYAGFLHDTNPTVNKTAILGRLIENLEKIPNQIQEKTSFQEAFYFYKSHCITMQKQVLVVIEGKKISGTAIDISENGALIIKTKDNTKKVIYSGYAHLTNNTIFSVSS